MPLPVRFIFFLVGPNDSEHDLHETGRAFATLMSSPVRTEVSWPASSLYSLQSQSPAQSADTSVGIGQRGGSSAPSAGREAGYTVRASPAHPVTPAV